MADQQAPQNLGGNLSAVQAINLGSTLSTPPTTAGPDLLPSFTGASSSSSSSTTVGGGGAQTYPTIASFPNAATHQGFFAIDASTNALYCANNGNWFVVAVLA